MPKTPKRPRDANLFGKMIVDLAVANLPKVADIDTRNQEAVALGKKGGKARAKKLTAEQRQVIAKKAANTRWKTK